MMKIVRTEADEIALLSVAAPALHSLLEKKKANAIKKICSDYHNNVADLRTSVATYIALNDLQREIETKLDSMERKDNE